MNGVKQNDLSSACHEVDQNEEWVSNLICTVTQDSEQVALVYQHFFIFIFALA